MTHPNSLWTFNLQNQTSPIGASDWKHKGRQMKLMTNYFSPSSSESPEGFSVPSHTCILPPTWKAVPSVHVSNVDHTKNTWLPMIPFDPV